MTYLNLEKYLPHKSPMILLDKAVEVTDEYAICKVDVTRESVLAPFLTEQGSLPSWYFVELMAQTIGVWNGVRLYDARTVPNIALLLGVRGFSSEIDEANLNDTLYVRSDLTLFDDNICSFSCTVMKENIIVSKANLVVYEAADKNIEKIFDWNMK